MGSIVKSLILQNLAAVTLALVTVPVWATQPVNNLIVGDQQQVAIASVMGGALDGDFVAAWATDGGDVSARVFDGDTGAAQTAEIAIGGPVIGAPAVAINVHGKYVVSWAQPAAEGSASVIRARVCTAATCASAFTVSTLTGSNTAPTVAIQNNSSFAVFWEGPVSTIKARLYTASRFSSIASSEVTASHATASAPTAAVLGGASDYVYALGYEAQDGAGNGVFFRAVASDATFATAQQVNSTTLGEQNKPRVASAPNGTCALTWEGPDGTGNRDIFTRFLAANLSTWDVETLVNSVTSGDQSTPSIAATAAGDYDFAWVSTSDGSSLRGSPIFIRGRRLGGLPPPVFTGGGASRTSSAELAVASGEVDAPSIAARTGGFTVAWELYSDGDGMGVVSERVTLP